MKYSVAYVVDRYLHNGEYPVYSPEKRTLVVSANNLVDAFIAAYAKLTEEGHTVCTVNSDGIHSIDTEYLHVVANLSGEEMQKIYDAGVPKNYSSKSNNYESMTHIKTINEFKFLPDSKSTVENETEHDFVSIVRLDELKGIRNPKFDFKKLIRLCEELNSCHKNKNYYAAAMLIRAILDHVPPIFGFQSFSQIANNYAGTRTFRQQMEHLENSSRKIADAHLHTMIRSKETLPTQTQINFSNDLDVLLGEIIRILS
jgi:hypothetical protein